MGLLLNKLFSIIFNRTMGPMYKMQMVDPESETDLIMKPELPSNLYVAIKKRRNLGMLVSGRGNCLYFLSLFVLELSVVWYRIFQPGQRFIFSVDVLQSRIRQLDHQFPGYLSPCPLPD